MVAAAVLRWVWLFLPLTLSHASTDSFFVVVPETPVKGMLGASVSLPCTLSNNLDVRTFEVRWYRPSMYSRPALLYNNEKIEESPTDEQYRGRVSLVGALEKGEVSLKLDNLKLADSGVYMCHVSSEKWYDKGNMSLEIQVVGSIPVLSVADAGKGQVKVSCHSHGWAPKPSLTWSDKEGRNLNHLIKANSTKVSEGLFSVSSWLLVSPSESNWISCSVALPDSDGQKRESRVVPHIETESWKGAFTVLLVLLLLFIIGVGVNFVLWRKGLIGSRTKKTEGREGREGTEGTHTLNNVEKQQLLQPQTAETPHQPESIGANPDLNVNSSPDAEASHPGPKEGSPPAAAEWDQLKKFKVNLSIDLEETPQFFRITHGGKRVHCSRPKEDDEDEESKIFTLCKEKFSSGQQCWEVKVCQKAKEKLSWFVGVAREEAENVHRIPLTPQNGFWVLCYEKEKGVYVRDSPEPTPLPDVSDKLTAVGVFLDCEEQTLSFYSVPTKSLIYTFTSVTSRTSLRPLISPGIRDSQPVRIC
ncbi:butyrophilin subfamily 2 member A1-like [Salminus brasiliensis]|uniref:butyrophilin subfamily 2 member A1-like n=1 Tax=Salminus brasiliensis TaxID=930266 RepID=UPI003B82F614